MKQRRSAGTPPATTRAASVLAPRNSVVGNPLLRKGGAHRKTGKALRRSDKVAIRSMPFELAASTETANQKGIDAMCLAGC